MKYPLIALLFLFFSIQPQPIVGINLSFGNYIGTDVTKEMLTNFINFANSAASFFKADVKSHVIYLKQNMDKLYSSGGQTFYVLIQTEDVLQSKRFWYQLEMDVVAELRNITLMYPNWSYFFIQRSKISNYQFSYLSNGIIGPGINKTINQLIETTIRLYEGNDQCKCYENIVTNIFQQLKRQSDSSWNVFCDNKGATTGYVQTHKGRYGTFNPKSCYYTIFAE